MDKYEEAVRIVNNYIRGLKECYENACDIVGDKSKTPAVRAKHARNAEEFYTLYNEVNCILQDGKIFSIISNRCIRGYQKKPRIIVRTTT